MANLTGEQTEQRSQNLSEPHEIQLRSCQDVWAATYLQWFLRENVKTYLLFPTFPMEKLLSQGYEKWNHFIIGSSPVASRFILHMLHHNAAVTLPARAESPSKPAMLVRQLIAKNPRYKPCFISFSLLGNFHSALWSFKHRGHTHSTL